MRILLKLQLDCSPDAAWRALRDPQVMRDVAFPLMTFTPADPAGFPEAWTAGEQRAAVKAFGFLPLGEQIIDISFPDRSDGVRMLRDSGHGVSGALALITTWRHSMAVAALPDGGTLYRDELRIEAGILTPLIWPVLWAIWQWRGLGLTRFAWKWRA